MIQMAAPVLQALLEGLRPGSSAQVSGLRGGALAWVAAALLKAQGGPLLLVTPTVEEAERIQGDLEFFLRTPEGRHDVLTYPGWDVEPYGSLSPHADISVQRLGALFKLRENARDLIVVAPAEALLKRVLPSEVMQRYVERLRINAEIDRDALIRRLAEAGYLSSDVVEDVGCFSVRGGILDLFPPLHSHPVRIELFGDTVESLREFDPVSQRSIRSLKELIILPVREEILAEKHVEHAASRLKVLSDALDRPSHLRRQTVEDMNQGIYFPGIEYHLAMLYPALPTVLEYFPKGNGRLLWVEPEQTREVLQAYHTRLERHFAMLDPKQRLTPPPETLFLRPEQLLEALELQPRLLMRELFQPSGLMPTFQFKIEPTSGLRQTLASHHDEGGMLKPLVERLKAWNEDDLAAFVVCHSPIQAQRLKDLLEPYGLQIPAPLPPLPISDLLRPPYPHQVAPQPLLGTLSAGFRFPEGRLVMLTEEDIFGPKMKTATFSKQFLRNAVSSFSQLNRGDFIVHATHGVGIFRGLTKLDAAGTANDFLLLEYSGGDRLYLPVHRLNNLQKYVGQGGTPTLDKMGGVTFARVKSRVKEQILKMAYDLLALYSARAVMKGHAFHLDRRAMEEFEAAFPYDETPDQLAAIEAVYQDMSSERPMDRLICGDVGYGKTEVAMRAAFVAILDGKQVAVLVPTTVLALQHHRSFVERFKEHPVRIDMLNRFRSTADQKRVLKELKEGKVDIVIGTHRLLSSDMEFKDLGLLVVDEEHRFGVSHKEKIKRLRKQLDVLTMTATPIPRTLHMALSGMREFSLITTPPRDRLAIRTYHVPFSPSQIQEAIRHELKRGGQVFFIHNRVQSIHAMARFLQKLVPEASVGVAHGQMEERALEKIMVEFIERKFDILCCTTIVESGLDIPSANTIIVNRADRFGLAQLYQLRGRVGRSSRRAFCYLLTPANQTLTPVTERRLQTLVNFTELGAGFKIATEDLEMRGAGDLLGTSQSGSINAVGMDMYCELLEKAIQELQGQEVIDEIEPDIDLKLPSYFPEEYIPDLHSRLNYYKQLSDARDETALYERMEEIEDRFGPAPEPVQNLMTLMRIRLMLRDARIRALSYSPGRLQVRLDESGVINRERLVATVSREPKRYKLTPDQRLLVYLSEEEARDLVRAVKKLLQILR